MEKFSDFLGQVGCLVWLGDVLKAVRVCSQDVRSLGSIQDTSSLHQALLREPTYSLMAKGSKTPPVNWASMVAGTHSLSPSLTDMEGGPVCADDHKCGPRSPFLHPTTPIPAILLPSGAFQSHMDESCGIYLTVISRITRIALA